MSRSRGMVESNWKPIWALMYMLVPPPSVTCVWASLRPRTGHPTPVLALAGAGGSTEGQGHLDHAMPPAGKPIRTRSGQAGEREGGRETAPPSPPAGGAGANEGRPRFAG